MRRSPATVVALLLLALILAGCAGWLAPARLPPSVANTPSPTLAPLPTFTPMMPLSRYYLYASPTLLIFLNFAAETAERASTTDRTTRAGGRCLATYEDRSMSYTVRGDELTIQSLYVTDAPFVVNTDGALTTRETDYSTGQILFETFHPSSIAAFQTALAHLRHRLPHC